MLRPAQSEVWAQYTPLLNICEGFDDNKARQGDKNVWV